MHRSQGDSCYLEWNDAMNTGIDVIDSDHRKLLSLIVQLSEAIDSNKDKAILESIFSELEDYIVQHFSREEALMRRCKYAGLGSHIELHRAFTDTIPKLKDKLLSSSTKKVAEETYLFLFNWLINHIIGEDMKFSQQAHKHGLAAPPKQQKISFLHKLSLTISHHVTLSRRVLMISLLPIMGMIALSITILSASVSELNAMKALQEKVHIVHYATKMNHSLQAERGFSAGYIASNYQQFFSELTKQRHQTDITAKQLTLQMSLLSDKVGDGELLKYVNAAILNLSKLNDYRKSIDEHVVSSKIMMNYYTEFVDILRDLPDNMIHLEMDSKYSNNIIALSSMMHLKEALGLQRAMGTRVLADRQLGDDDLRTYLSLNREKHGAMGMFRHAAIAEQKQAWKKLQSEEINGFSRELDVKFIASLSNGGSSSISSKQWFEVHSIKMNQVLTMSYSLLNNLENNVKNCVNNLYSRLYVLLAIFAGLILLTILFSRILTYSITYPVKRMTHAMTSLSKGNREVRFDEVFAKDEFDRMADAYEKCRIGLLQADLATAVYLHRQDVDLKRTLHEQHIKSVIQDYALDCIITCDKNFIITDINPSTESLFQLRKVAAIGQSLTGIIIGIEDQLLNVHFETDAIKSDQTRFHVEASISNIKLDDFEGRICFIRDASARKKAEESVHKLSQAIEQAGESILITNREGIIEYVNAAFTKLTGYSANEAIGNTPRMLKSGNQNEAFYKQLWETITDGKIWQNKVVERRKDGAFFPVMLTIAPITNDDGLITHFVGSHTDITDLENMEEQFHQAQKMEAIGTLVGGIAHDFNNMLAGITGNLYLAKKSASEMPDLTRKLDNIEELSFRAAAMIKQLLTFARKDRVSTELMPLSPFIKETMKFLHLSIPENISVIKDICADPLPVKADATQLHQVLMNLINNACDAVENVEEPRIAIFLEAFQADKQFVQSNEKFNVGWYAHLRVEDNGCGICEEHLEHLFEPFFTNKEQGKGTGLGLAMVYGAIANHHGHIEVESIEGEGSVFHVYMPLQEGSNVDAAFQKTHKVMRDDGKGELILLVDDQEQVLEVAQEVLESMGYKILIAKNGQLAVDIYKARAEEIALCVFDVVMPVMGGDKAAKIIRQIDPEAKIIFATGYDKSLLREMDNESILAKPFDFNEMNRLIQEMLGK